MKTIFNLQSAEENEIILRSCVYLCCGFIKLTMLHDYGLLGHEAINLS